MNNAQSKVELFNSRTAESKKQFDETPYTIGDKKIFNTCIIQQH